MRREGALFPTLEGTLAHGDSLLLFTDGLVDAPGRDGEARGVAVQLGAPECRRSLCRVVIGAADSAALGKAYGLLESEDGLYGWADALLLERVVTGDDGRVETGVIAQFGRDGSE